MLSFLNMECPACGAEYTLSIEELNIMVLFRCFECGHNNMYVAGHVLELDRETMENGTEKQKKRHIVETAQMFGCEFAGNVVENVDRVIDVNMETELPQTTGRRKSKKRIRRKKASRKKEIQGRRLSPSIKLADAPRITSREIEDFRRIDLKLIDNRAFFERFFGDSKN